MPRRYESRIPDAILQRELAYVARDARRAADIAEREAAVVPLLCARCDKQERRPRSPYCSACDWTAPLAVPVR